MHSYDIEILAPAWKELEEIAQMHLFLAGAVSAQSMTDRILDDLEMLRTSPYMGKACEEPLLAAENYRRLITGKYLCFYRVIGSTVYVYHIVSEKRDYPKIFE